jgi:hypothetical protein
MNARASLLVLSLAAASGYAVADSVSVGLVRYTDAAPYSDLIPPGAASGAPQFWKGERSRSEVISELLDPRTRSTLAAGEALDYPLTTGNAPATMATTTRSPGSSVMGGPRARSSDVPTTHDGYRFIGGEIGYTR